MKNLILAYLTLIFLLPKGQTQEMEAVFPLIVEGYYQKILHPIDHQNLYSKAYYVPEVLGYQGLEQMSYYHYEAWQQEARGVFERYQGLKLPQAKTVEALALRFEGIYEKHQNLINVCLEQEKGDYTASMMPNLFEFTRQEAIYMDNWAFFEQYKHVIPLNISLYLCSITDTYFPDDLDKTYRDCLRKALERNDLTSSSCLPKQAWLDRDKKAKDKIRAAFKKIDCKPCLEALQSLELEIQTHDEICKQLEKALPIFAPLFEMERGRTWAKFWEDFVRALNTN